LRVKVRGGVRRATEDGAAALEFALVSTLLFTLIFGIIQYGLFFNDSINLRQGVREAARSGVVENFTYPGCSAASNAANLSCAVVGQVGALTGTPVVKIYAPNGWARGKPLRVCAALKSSGSAGYLPMPNGGVLTAVTQMSIEQEAQKATWTDDTPPADPSGAGWSWC